MAIDPNVPPTGRDRLNNPNMAPGPVTSVRTGSSSSWMIGLVVLAIIVLGALFMWPDRASNVAGGRDPATTGTTTERTTTPAPAIAPTPMPTPAPAAPTPISPTPAAPR